MLKIAVITANIGEIDSVPAFPKQDIECDYHCFTEKNLPFPLPNLDNRTKSRYLKMNAHRYLPDYDVYIWIDGRVKVTSESFVNYITDLFHFEDFILCKHPERKAVSDEMEFILHEMNKGNNYLISRYGHQFLRDEMNFYISEKYDNTTTLFASGIFARKNNGIANSACNEWWLRSLEFSNLDQAMLSYIKWKRRLQVYEIPFDNEHFKVLKHEQITY